VRVELIEHNGDARVSLQTEESQEDTQRRGGIFVGALRQQNAVDESGVHVHHRQQRQCSVPTIFMFKLRGLPGPHRSIGRCAFEGLNAAFLVERDDDPAVASGGDQQVA
jgi:hypothetical protein